VYPDISSQFTREAKEIHIFICSKVTVSIIFRHNLTTPTKRQCHLNIFNSLGSARRGAKYWYPMLNGSEFHPIQCDRGLDQMSAN